MEPILDKDQTANCAYIQLYSGQALNAVKNVIRREITQRQHRLELQFLGTALLTITTNKHTKFQVIPP